MGQAFPIRKMPPFYFMKGRTCKQPKSRRLDSSVRIWHNRSARENPSAYGLHVEVVESRPLRRHTQIITHSMSSEKSEKSRPQCNRNSINRGQLQLNVTFCLLEKYKAFQIQRYSRENSEENFGNDLFFLDLIALSSRV